MIAGNGDTLVFDDPRGMVSLFSAGRWRKMPLRISQWVQADREVLLVPFDRKVLRYVGAPEFWQETGLTVVGNTLWQAGEHTFVLDAVHGRVHYWKAGGIDTKFQATQLWRGSASVLTLSSKSREVFRCNGSNAAAWENLGLTISGRVACGADGATYAVSEGKLYRFDGTKFKQVPLDEKLHRAALGD